MNNPYDLSNDPQFRKFFKHLLPEEKVEKPDTDKKSTDFMTELTEDQIKYPKDVFWDLIEGNSPYAFYIFQWVPYHHEDVKTWRLKMLHDVKTFDGREALGIWPNANSCGPFKDDEVEFIRISKKQHGSEWSDPKKTTGVK